MSGYRAGDLLRDGGGPPPHHHHLQGGAGCQQVQVFRDMAMQFGLIVPTQPVLWSRTLCSADSEPYADPAPWSND